jgi:hypothetical protein
MIAGRLGAKKDSAAAPANQQMATARLMATETPAPAQWKQDEARQPVSLLALATLTSPLAQWRRQGAFAQVAAPAEARMTCLVLDLRAGDFRRLAVVWA